MLFRSTLSLSHRGSRSPTGNISHEAIYKPASTRDTSVIIQIGKDRADVTPGEGIYEIHIDSFTPETIPMARHADYMSSFGSPVRFETAISDASPVWTRFELSRPKNRLHSNRHRSFVDKSIPAEPPSSSTLGAQAGYIWKRARYKRRVLRSWS